MAHRNVGYFFMCYLRFLRLERKEVKKQRSWSENEAKLERKYAYMRKIGKF